MSSKPLNTVSTAKILALHPCLTGLNRFDRRYGSKELVLDKKTCHEIAMLVPPDNLAWWIVQGNWRDGWKKYRRMCKLFESLPCRRRGIVFYRLSNPSLKNEILAAFGL